MTWEEVRTLASPVLGEGKKEDLENKTNTPIFHTTLAGGEGRGPLFSLLSSFSFLIISKRQKEKGK